MNEIKYLTLEEEARDGFVVSPMRKKVWICEMKIMKWFCDICEENSINYFLLGGSALGAVRHSGFIPWDDDIDIGLLRNDFDKFIKVVKNLKNVPFCIEYGVIQNVHVSVLLRIRDNATTGIILDEYKHRLGGGIFIELYPFDNVPDSRLLRKNQQKISSILSHLMLYKNDYNNYTGIKKYLLLLTRKIPLDKLWKWYMKNCIFFNKRSTLYVGRPATPTYDKAVGSFKREELENTIFWKFENTELRIPRDYDSFLKQSFGINYMELPPINKRGMHHEHIVFYDAEKSYDKMIESGVVESYFSE